MKNEYLTLDNLLLLSADLRVPGVRDLGLPDAPAADLAEGGGLNGFDLDAPEDEAYDLVIATATLPYQSVAERLAEWARASHTADR
ncbi:hypothetical protein CU254_02115 [Amycolatopsis sp. AA4]|uniref:hypothetical protein n=1 Tax=Actinomycetes TaxID=1760 RepID=UPI0001B58528|nr:MULTISPECIES: hypothetical protein [Actinomycetes]ATY09407.1 hypothetical protein CU254_02115 [Amycolatopsis sp. AA4]EFL04737.1 predicted protein [Streptomyces sp. AA4]